MSIISFALLICTLFVPLNQAATCQSGSYNPATVVESETYSYSEFTAMSRLYNVAIGPTSGDMYNLGIGNDGSQDSAMLKRETVDGTSVWVFAYPDISPVDKSLAVDPTETYVFFTDLQSSYCLMAQVFAANGTVFNYAQFSTIISRQPYYKIYFDSAGDYLYLSLVDSDYNCHF